MFVVIFMIVYTEDSCNKPFVPLSIFVKETFEQLLIIKLDNASTLSASTMSDKLLQNRQKRPDAKVRLICFPWAGSGANQFIAWGKQISKDVEVLGVMLPGRESRYKETPCASARQLANDIAEVIERQCSDKPFFFFGHSLGALLCQEVAAVLKSDYNGLEPCHVYLSGESPPHSERKKPRKDYYEMDDQEFTKELQIMGCVPTNVMTNPELLKVYLPAFRADLTVVNQMVYDLPRRLLSQPLSCPILYFQAMEDNEYDHQGWGKLTTGQLTVKQMTGGHFYLKDPLNLDKMLNIIGKDAADLA